MNYILKPSLKHIALVEIATTLWNQDNIRALMKQFCFPLHGSGRREKWQEIENKVIEKVPQLSLPESLKQEILGFIYPVGLQILKWMRYHVEHCYIGKRVPSELFWTPQGTVDKKKTAEALIKDESLDITTRYTLACIYCLESDIIALWNKMSENCRESFYSEEDPRNVRQQPLVILWTYDIKGEVARLDNWIERTWRRGCTPYQYAFEYAALDGNKAATEYFLQKLTPREREESLVISTGDAVWCGYRDHRTDFPKERYADVLFFLLSQIDEEQQIEVFKINPYQASKCLLDWPWQSLLMETTNRMWDFLSERDYEKILKNIIHKVTLGYKEYNYQKLFGEFWQQSPNAHKKYVIDKCASGRPLLLSKLFEIEDKENVKLILKHATLTEKEKIISYHGKDICVKLLYKDKWNLLNFFIHELISTKDIMVKFKEEFKEHIRCLSEERLESEKDMWSKFFQLLDDHIHKDDEKRGIEEEGNSGSAKRLCSVEFSKK